ncbi:hypothetical protein CPAR01_10769 [Colletotrichum paranaense]|uniref:Transposase n=1 Tax=Colletotrichum paranaense TaxID=1914294 RepID=A0ABQ9S9Q0_9PEZI|nr:uncharacterized protein CPAR01_10769 [Colletotrichum paranaense]KAK1531120.1 hypothetical protein CPAR01_10769 [Colletotrichum paranaense]
MTDPKAKQCRRNASLYLSWPRMVAEYCKSTCRVWWVHAVGDELRMWFRYLNRRDSLEIERMTWYKHVKTGSCRASQIVIDNSIPMVVNRDLVPQSTRKGLRLIHCFSASFVSRIWRGKVMQRGVTRSRAAKGLDGIHTVFSPSESNQCGRTFVQLQQVMR